MIALAVAPLAGAWIEMKRWVIVQRNGRVAPLAGAWIEIRRFSHFCLLQSVAPLAGAWIEILPSNVLRLSEYRRSPCGSVD